MCSKCAMSNSQVKLGVLGTEEDRLNRASCETQQRDSVGSRRQKVVTVSKAMKGLSKRTACGRDL